MDGVQINQVLLAACSERQHGPWQPRGSTGEAVCGVAGPCCPQTLPAPSAQPQGSRATAAHSSARCPDQLRSWCWEQRGLCQDWDHSTQAVPPSPRRQSGAGLRTKARGWAGQGLRGAIFASRLKAFVWLCSCRRSRSGLLRSRKGFLNTNSLLHNRQTYFPLTLSRSCPPCAGSLCQPSFPSSLHQHPLCGDADQTKP